MGPVTGYVRSALRLMTVLVAVALFVACAMDEAMLVGSPEPDDGWWPDGDGDVDADADSDSDSDVDGDADGDWVPPMEPGVEEPPPEEPECNSEDEVVLYLSADDSNSMAGPALARQLLRQGQLPVNPVRIYEFLNYYDFDYEAADQGTVRVSAEMRPVDETGGSYELQIGVRAHDQGEAERRPLNITLSLDTSGSMSGQPIDMVQASCYAIAHSLRAGDVVSMVTWSTTQNIMLHSHAVEGPDDPTLVGQCEQISANGGTDLHAGLVTAYELAQENFSQDRINRVILMSDGGANVGVTDANLIAAHADDAEGEAIYLMGVGMGSGASYNDELMDTITDAGKGAYVYIDSGDEAHRMFGPRFLQNVEVAVRDVRVELTLPPTFSMEEFHGEEYSDDPAEVEPQHLAPNDAMIYHQIVASCDPESLDLEGQVQVVASFAAPLTREPEIASFETTLGELLEADDARLVKGNAIVAYAQALETCRTAGTREPLRDALAEVDAALERLGEDPDLLEIRELLQHVVR